MLGTVLVWSVVPSSGNTSVIKNEVCRKTD